MKCIVVPTTAEAMQRLDLDQCLPGDLLEWKLSAQDYAALCDVFYLGGTKCGALFGEAVVITNDDLKPDFRYCLKQHGGMLAKGRLLGEQFLALLDGEDGGKAPQVGTAQETPAVARRAI